MLKLAVQHFILLGALLVTAACGQQDVPGAGNVTAFPTTPPTTSPTESPTQAATESPTAMPTQAPVTTPTQAPTTEPTKSAEVPVTNPEERRAVMAARRALAKERNVQAEDLRLVSIEQQEWSDSSLGCPEPGMMYAQVITPGYLVVFETGGDRYEVHTDKNGRAVFCEKGTSRTPSGDILL